ncbi:unnamed protein product [Pieris macdunnoughi]|uniref:Uncharacterized protein n=1 Tax=Pieris macdunnoughi TaxID=345717 RepID=A0A821Y2E9_9NEOP|nr:unnamed protein product [Pieris macdunnoughi]
MICSTSALQSRHTAIGTPRSLSAAGRLAGPSTLRVMAPPSHHPSAEPPREPGADPPPSDPPPSEPAARLAAAGLLGALPTLFSTLPPCKLREVSYARNSTRPGRATIGDERLTESDPPARINNGILTGAASRASSERGGGGGSSSGGEGSKEGLSSTTGTCAKCSVGMRICRQNVSSANARRAGRGPGRRDSHLGATAVADGPLAELAPLSPGTEDAEAGLEAEEAHAPLLDVLLDAALDGQHLQLRLREHRPDVHDLLEGQRQPLLAQQRVPPPLLRTTRRPVSDDRPRPERGRAADEHTDRFDEVVSQGRSGPARLGVVAQAAQGTPRLGPRVGHRLSARRPGGSRRRVRHRVAPHGGAPRRALRRQVVRCDSARRGYFPALLGPSGIERI